MSINRPIVKPVSKHSYEVVEDYLYDNLVVPKGYKTNGANIPRIFWSIFPPNSPEYLSAIIVHDFVCDVATNDVSCPVILGATQEEIFEYADNNLKAMMLELGCSKLKANIFYWSVRLYHKIKYWRK